MDQSERRVGRGEAVAARAWEPRDGVWRATVEVEGEAGIKCGKFPLPIVSVNHQKVVNYRLVV